MSKQIPLRRKPIAEGKLARRLLSETSLSDGTILYLVLPVVGDGTDVTLEDVLIEINDEIQLYNIIRGSRRTDLPYTRLFTNKAQATKLAEERISKSGGDQLGEPAPLSSPPMP